MSALKSYIDRILRLKEEQDGIGADIRDVYTEARSHGFDKTALGQVVAILRKKAKDPNAFEERSAIVDLYLSEYEQPSRAHTRARERTPTRGDAHVLAEARELNGLGTDPVSATHATFPEIPAFLDRRSAA